MATLKLAILKDKPAKDGSLNIKIAIGHKSTTHHIATRFKINSVSQFKNGQVVKRPDASIINTKLRTLLNEYQEKLDNIKNVSMYDCKQIRDILVNGCGKEQTAATFQATLKVYIGELIAILNKEKKKVTTKRPHPVCRPVRAFNSIKKHNNPKFQP